MSSGKHAKAELGLHALQVERNRLEQQLAQKHLFMERQLADLRDHIFALQQELAMKEDVLRFDELRFQQGKIGYDALIHSRLEVLHLKISLGSLKRQAGREF